MAFLSSFTGAAGFILGLTVAGVVGASTTLLAWNWRAGQVQSLKADVAHWEQATAQANEKADHDAKISQAAVTKLVELLVEQGEEYEDKFQTINKKLADVASVTRRALNARTVGVLNNGTGPGPKPSPHKDPLAILSLRSPGSTPNPPGPSRGPAQSPGVAPAPVLPTPIEEEDLGGVSEYELSRWINFARCSYVRQKSLTGFLQGAVKAAPQCFEVIDDGGMDYNEETALICARQ